MRIYGRWSGSFSVPFSLAVVPWNHSLYTGEVFNIIDPFSWNLVLLDWNMSRRNYCYFLNVSSWKKGLAFRACSMERLRRYRPCFLEGNVKKYLLFVNEIRPQRAKVNYLSFVNWSNFWFYGEIDLFYFQYNTILMPLFFSFEVKPIGKGKSLVIWNENDVNGFISHIFISVWSSEKVLWSCSNSACSDQYLHRASPCIHISYAQCLKETTISSRDIILTGKYLASFSLRTTLKGKNFLPLGA